MLWVQCIPKPEDAKQKDRGEPRTEDRRVVLRKETDRGIQLYMQRQKGNPDFGLLKDS